MREIWVEILISPFFCYLSVKGNILMVSVLLILIGLLITAIIAILYRKMQDDNGYINSIMQLYKALRERDDIISNLQNVYNNKKNE